MKTILSAIAILLLMTNLAEATDRKRVGYAYKIDSKELLYTETHNEIWKDGLIVSDKVVYRDAQGNVFAEKQVDFRNNRFAPDFTLKNQRTGHLEAGSNKRDDYEIEFRPVDTADKKTEVVDLPSNAIADAGFDEFIIRNWDEIIAGKTLRRDFLIPSMFGFYDFRIYQSDVLEKENQKRRVINVESNNFFYRLLGAKTQLEYAYDEPSLKTFTGVSNMRDEEGNNLNVRIVFPPEEIRVVSSDNPAP